MSSVEDSINKVFSDLKAHTSNLKSTNKDADEAVSKYKDSLGTASVWNKFLVFLGAKDTNLEEVNLKDLNKLLTSLGKEEEALSKIEDSLLPWLSRRLFALQGGFMSMVADLSQLLGPHVYVVVKLLESIVELILMGDDIHSSLYKDFYEGLAGSGNLSTRYHKDIPKLLNLLQHEGATFSLSPDSVITMYKNMQLEGATLRLTEDVTANLELLRKNVVEPAATFGAIFGTGAEAASKALAKVEFDTGRTQPQVRSFFTSFLKEVAGVPLMMERYSSSLISLDSKFAHIGGLSDSTVAHLGKFVKDRNGSRQSLEALEKITLDSLDNVGVMRLLERGLVNNPQLMSKLHTQVENTKPKGDYDNSLREDVLRTITNLGSGKEVLNEASTLKLKKYLEPNGILRDILKDSLDSFGPVTFQREFVKEVFKIPYMEFMSFLNTGKVTPLKDKTSKEKYYKAMSEMSGDLGKLQIGMLEYLDLSLRGIKMDLILPAITYFVSRLEGLFSFVADSWISRYFLGDFDAVPIIKLDVGAKKLLTSYSKLEGITEMMRGGKEVSTSFLESKKLSKNALDYLEKDLEKNKGLIRSKGERAYSVNLTSIRDSINLSLLKGGDLKGFRERQDRRVDPSVLRGAYSELLLQNDSKSLNFTLKEFDRLILEYGKKSKELIIAENEKNPTLIIEKDNR